MPEGSPLQSSHSFSFLLLRRFGYGRLIVAALTVAARSFALSNMARLAEPFGFLGELAQPDGVRIGCVQSQPLISEEPGFELLVRHRSPDAYPFVVYHLLFFFPSRCRHGPSIAEISPTVISPSSPSGRLAIGSRPGAETAPGSSWRAGSLL
jgi:hypothetical protein